MNDTKKIDMFKNVILLLEEEKNSILANLKAIKHAISKKTETINRIIAYRNEYNNQNNQNIPALIANRNEFLKKLDNAIHSEKIGIDQLESEKINIIQKINVVESKISTINTQLERAMQEVRAQKENRDANESDDMNVQSKLRNNL